MSLRGDIISIGVKKVLDSFLCKPCGIVSHDADVPRICPRCFNLMTPLYKEVPQRVAV